MPPAPAVMAAQSTVSANMLTISHTLPPAARGNRTISSPGCTAVDRNSSSGMREPLRLHL